LGAKLDQASDKGIAKFLVEKDLLALADAQALLASAAKAPAPKAAPPDEDDFGLAPLEEDGFAPLPSTPTPAPKPASAPRPPAKKAAAAKRPSAPAPAPPADDGGSLLEELEELGSPGMPTTGLSAASPLDALAHDNSATANPLLAPAARKRGFGWGGSKEPKKRKKGDNQFDSPLMLFGGGGLLLLSIVGGLLLFFYLRGSGDEQFRLAEEDYRGGSYTQAIVKYTTFLEKHATHPKASAAKVHRGLAQLRQAVEQNKDYVHALEVALKVIPEIENEREFTDARVEFRSLLPAIAEGLASDAAKQKTPEQIRERLQLAEKALAMVLNTNYVAKSAQPMQRITTIRESMTVAQRELDRDADLTQTLASIEAAATQGNVAEAYRHRRVLLKTYPDLAANELLVAAIGAVAQREQAAVEIARAEQPPVAAPATSPVLAAWTMTERRQTASAKGPAVALRIEGALYGIDSGSGTVLWRHYLGGRGDASPLEISQGDKTQLLVTDENSQQLLLLDVQTGEPVWRQKLAGRSMGLALVRGDQPVVVSASEEQIAVIELASGKQIAQAKLPQKIRVRPTPHPSGAPFYQIGEQASIYVFSPELACEQAFYLGHDPGSIRLAPIALARHLIVAENRGSAAAALVVLKLDEQGKIEGPVQRVEIPGLLVTPPVLADRRLVAVTDRGHVKVLEINPSNLDAPLVEIADQPALAGSEPLARHLVMNAGDLWMADKTLNRYRVQAAAGRLMPAPLTDDYENGTFVTAPVVVGNLLVHARRATRELVTLVSGTQLDDGKRVWETAVAIAPASAPIAMQTQLAAIGSSGSVFVGINSNGGKAASQVVEGTRMELELGQPPLRLSSRVDLPGGMMVFAPASEDNRMLTVALKGQGGLAEPKLLPLPDVLACPPTAWGKGVVVPTAVGQVFWVNPANGKPVAAPFQPEVSVGVAKGWTTPAASKSGNELVLTDGNRVFVVTLEREPSPHLAARGESAPFQVPLTSPVAVVGDRAVVVDEGGTLHALDLASLEVAADSPLVGPAIWGPVNAGEVVLVASGEGVVECLDAAAKPQWQWKHPAQAIPVGAAMVDSTSATVSFADGRVVRFNLADGSVVASVELGQPLATGAVAAGKGLAAITRDGTVLLFALGAGETSAESTAGVQP
jgi:outer membrane protein assembly factor BamB